MEFQNFTITCTVLDITNKTLDCEGVEYQLLVPRPGPTEYMFYVYLVLYIVLVSLSGLFSGLVLGLISLDVVNLEVLQKGGKPRQRKYASRILRIVKYQHWLLVTLLIAYAAVLEILPICLNAIASELVAIVVSVTAVLLFGEILPNAVCARYGLIIGYYFAPLVWVMMVLFFPIAYPLALLLDCTLGPKPGAFFRRAELRELVKMHGLTQRGGNEEPLTFDEVLVVRGALEMRDKTVANAMTPLDSVYMLDVEGKLDRKAIGEIVQKGHSRIPLYESDRSNVIGRLLVKQLLKLDPNDATPVKLVEGAFTRPPSCLLSMPLYELLKQIISDKGQKGHLYLVYDETKGSRETNLVGIITLEDIIEELLGEEIVDETDMYVDVHKKIAAARARQMYHTFYTTYASPSSDSMPINGMDRSLDGDGATPHKRKRYGRKGKSHFVQTIKSSSALDAIPEDKESPISKSMPFVKPKGFKYGGID